MKINVLDAMMGSGKTTRLIDMMSKLPSSTKIIYITPLLSECHRIAGTEATSPEDPNPVMITDTEYLYNNSKLANRRFRHPLTYMTGSKLESFKHLVTYGCNIVSTHALFAKLTPEITEIIRNQGYILILDEVISMYESYNSIDIKAIKTCIENKWMYVDEDKFTLSWNHNIGSYLDLPELDEVGQLCDNKQLLMVDDKILMVEFPAHVLNAFRRVFIASYMFTGSQMYPYLLNNGMTIDIDYFGNKPSSVKSLITVIDDDKMNSIGNHRNSFSVSSFKRQETDPSYVDIDIAHAKLHTFFRSKCKTPLGEMLWTTFKPNLKGMSKRRYTKSWLACTTKATNDYQHTSAVAYMMNLFPNPMIVKVLSYKGSNIDADKYALSEMVQFIWRSRIRNNEPIHVYIPSSRMRNLFIRWLNDEFEIA